MATKTETFEGWPTVLLPFGLSTLLKNMSRDVMIEQPENIACFLADYTSELLLYRNQNPTMDLNEVIILFQNRREEIMNISSEVTAGEVRDIGKESETSSPNLPSTSQEAAHLSVDRSQSSEVSVTPPEDVLGVKLLEETLLVEEAAHLSVDRSQSSEVSVTPPEDVLGVKLLEETLLVEEAAHLRVDRSQSSEVSVTPPEDVLGVKLLEETLLVEEAAHLSVDRSQSSEVSVTPPDDLGVKLLEETQPVEVKPQPMPLRKPMKRLAATLKRAAVQMKLSRSDGETTNQAKLVKSSSLQDSGVLMSSEVTYKSDTTQQEAFLDKVKHPPDKHQPLTKPMRKLGAALKRAAIQMKHFMIDGETTEQVKYSPGLAKVSSQQDCVLISYEVTDKSFTMQQEASLEKEVAKMTSEETEVGVDEIQSSEVSVSTTESVSDVELLQETPLVEAKLLPMPPLQPKGRSAAASKRVAMQMKRSRSDGEIIDQVKYSTGLAKVSSQQNCVLMSSEVTDKSVTMQQEASLEKEVAKMASEESEVGVDEIQSSEVSVTTYESVSDIDLLQITPLIEEFAKMTIEESGVGVDEIQSSEVRVTTAESVSDVDLLLDIPLFEAKHLPMPPLIPKGRSAAASKRAAIQMKRSRSDGETTDKVKYSTGLAKASSLQDYVLLSSEVTDKSVTMQQEASLEKEVAKMTSEESEVGVDEIQSSEVSVTTYESVSDVELPQETPLVEEVAKMASEESEVGVDEIQSSEVSVSTLESISDVDLLLDIPLVEAKLLPMPPLQPKGRSAAASKRAAIQMKRSRSDGETTDKVKYSTGLAKASSHQDYVLMSSEVTDKSVTMQQEASLEKEVAKMASEESGVGVDEIQSSEVSVSTTESVSDVDLLQDTPLVEEVAKMTSEESEVGVDEIQSSEVSVTTLESVSDVELLQITPLVEVIQLSSGESSNGFDRTQSSEVSVTTPENDSDVVFIQETPLDEGIKTETTRTVPLEKLSSSSSSSSLSTSSSLSSASYSERPSSSESVSDDNRTAKELLLGIKTRKLSSHSCSRSSKTSTSSTSQKPFRLLPKRQKIGKESFQSRAAGVTVKSIGTSTEDIKLPHLPSSCKRPQRKPGPRSTEKQQLPQIGTKSQKPRPSQGIRISPASSKREKENLNKTWTLYHLPHREEEGTLSTTILSQPQYQDGAKIQAIGPGYIILTECPTTGSPIDQDNLVIKPPPLQRKHT